MCLEQRASCLEAGNLCSRRTETLLWFQVRWFQVRLVHFRGNAALNMFEGEDHARAALETLNKVFHPRQRARANWRTLAQDQHRMRLRFTNMLSRPQSINELVGQRQRFASNPAHHGQRPGDIQHPQLLGTLAAHKKGSQKQGNP
jgi:hypothetical protein